MKLFVLLGLTVASSGCRFLVDGVAPFRQSVDAGAASDLALGAGPDLLPMPADLTALPATASFCGEPGLVSCYQFEDGATATVAADGTVHHNDLTLVSANETSGGHSGDGLSVGVGSLVHLAHNATFDIAEVTIEMWIKPSALPGTGARAGLTDEDGQYGLFIYAPGVLTCNVGGSVSSASAQITVGQWQHVACTYDGTTIRLYYDGKQVAEQAYSVALATNQLNGLCVGSNSPSGDNFAGLLDDVRIFGVARSARNICADSGQSDCQ